MNSIDFLTIFDTATSKMTDERINAVLGFAGGMLALIAAFVPIMRTTFKKLTAAPNREQIFAMLIAAVQLGFWLGGAGLVLFSTHGSLGISCVAVSVLIYIVMFLREAGHPSRRAIVFDVVIPIVYVFYLILVVAIGDLKAQLKAQSKEGEISGSAQPAGRSESNSESIDKHRPESEERSR